jgi:hypothetical protein
MVLGSRGRRGGGVWWEGWLINLEGLLECVLVCKFRQAVGSTPEWDRIPYTAFTVLIDCSTGLPRILLKDWTKAPTDLEMHFAFSFGHPIKLTTLLV